MRLTTILLPLLLVGATPCPAARIYRVLSLHAQQLDLLSGEIVTTHDAPDDGRLAAEEILSWRWRASGSVMMQATSEAEAPFTVETLADGILISPAAIQLPSNRPAHLELTQRTSTSRGPFFDRAHWFTAEDGASAFAYDWRVTAFRGDVGYSYTSVQPTSAVGPFTIAVAVPEPRPVALLTLALCVGATVVRQQPIA